MTIGFRRAFFQDTWTTYKNKRSICRDSNNFIFIAYTDYSGPWRQVVLARTMNKGKTWTFENIPGQDLGSHQVGITITVNSDNHIIAVWDADGSVAYCKRDVAGNWGSIITVAASPPACSYPSVAIDSSNTSHIVWAERSLNEDIRYNTVDKEGILGAQVSVTDLDPSRQVAPSIAVCRNDVAHIVWRGTGWGANPSFYNILYNTVAAGGLGVQVHITDRAATCGNAECVIDSNAFAHVVYYEEWHLGTPGTYYTNNASGNFVAPTWLTLAGSVGLSITMDAKDNLYVFSVRPSTLPAPRYMDILTNKGAGWITEIIVPLVYQRNDIYSMWSWYPRVGSTSPNIPLSGWLAYMFWPRDDFYAYLFPVAAIRHHPVKPELPRASEGIASLVYKR